MYKDKKENNEEIPLSILNVLDHMIIEEETKIENIYLGEDPSDYVRYIEIKARRDALNSIKSYIIGAYFKIETFNIDKE